MYDSYCMSHKVKVRQWSLRNRTDLYEQHHWPIWLYKLFCFRNLVLLVLMWMTSKPYLSRLFTEAHGNGGMRLFGEMWINDPEMNFWSFISFLFRAWFLVILLNSAWWRHDSSLYFLTLSWISPRLVPFLEFFVRLDPKEKNLLEMTVSWMSFRVRVSKWFLFS